MPDPSKFRDPERLAQAFDNQPDAAVRTLDALLDETQAAALEAALVPPASLAVRAETLRRVRQELLRAGFDDDDLAVLDRFADDLQGDAR